MKKYYYEAQEKLKENLRSFIDAYNFGKRLKALNGLTVFDYIIKCWDEEPDKFKTNPMHRFSGLYTCSCVRRRTRSFAFSVTRLVCFSRYFRRSSIGVLPKQEKHVL